MVGLLIDNDISKTSGWPASLSNPTTPLIAIPAKPQLRPFYLSYLSSLLCVIGCEFPLERPLTLGTRNQNGPKQNEGRHSHKGQQEVGEGAPAGGRSELPPILAVRGVYS